MLPATPPVVPTVLPLAPVRTLIVVPAVLALLVLRLDDERWRREGVGWLGPDMRWFALWSLESGRPVDVEDAVEATDAVCWRSRESSRVSLFT